MIAGVLKAKIFTVVLAIAILGASYWPAKQLGSEFMPTLDEGTLFYMPTTLPGLSVTKAAELLQTQNKIIKSFPEVETVFGKAGRASKRHRSRPHRDDRNRDHPQAQGANGAPA